MDKEEKIKAIAEILEDQKSLIKRLSIISKKPETKRINIAANRLTEMFSCFNKIRSLEIQKHIIISQPYLKLKEGGVSISKSCISEAGKEFMLSK